MFLTVKQLKHLVREAKSHAKYATKLAKRANFSQETIDFIHALPEGFHPQTAKKPFIKWLANQLEDPEQVHYIHGMDAHTWEILISLIDELETPDNHDKFYMRRIDSGHGMFNGYPEDEFGPWTQNNPRDRRERVWLPSMQPWHKMSFEQLARYFRDWEAEIFHREMEAYEEELNTDEREDAESDDTDETQEQEIYWFNDGWTITQVPACKLGAEGNRMQHCVGTDHRDAVYQNEEQVFSLRDSSNRPHATISVKLATSAVVEIKGKQNAVPKKEYFEKIVKWLATTQYSVDKSLDYKRGIQMYQTNHKS